MSNTLAAISAAINLGALIFVGLQVRLAASTAADSSAARTAQWDQDKQRATMEFYQTSLVQRADFHSELPSDPGEIKKVIQSAKTNPSTDAKIGGYLNYHELLATGVNLGILDEKFIVEFARNSIVEVWDTYQPWVAAQRKSRGYKAYDQLEIFVGRLKPRLLLDSHGSERP